MNSTDSPHDLHLDGTFGCAFIAGITTSALWGAWTVQLYYYCNHFWKTDKWWLRFHVLTVWALDTTHQILEVEPFYVYLIKEFGNISYLSRLDSHLIDTFALTGFVNLAVQMLFVTRIWRLSHGNYYLNGAVIALVIAQFVAQEFYFAQAVHFQFVGQLYSIVLDERIEKSITAAADITITCVLAFLLHFSRSGLKTTDTLINRLIIYSVNTGAITSMLAIAALVSGLVLPDSFLYILLCLLIPKVYTNSILALLNSRQGLRDELSGVAQGISIHTSQSPIHRAEATRSDNTMYGPQIMEDGKRNVLVGESGSSISQ
ncbi:hypothetical protein ACEPAF_267 [Sanghuangporus sanghuang]